MKKNEVDPFLVRICNPEEPGRNLKALLQMQFDEEEISVSEKACFLPGATAHRHDVVLFAMDEEKGVGQIQMFAKIGLANYACLHLWDPCGVNRFQMRSKPVMVPLDAIIDTCIYTIRHGDEVDVVPTTTRI